MKHLLAKAYAKIRHKALQRHIDNPIQSQQKIFQRLITIGKNTYFGEKHNFSDIKTYEDYQTQVPVRDYEGFKPYITKALSGEPDVIWRGLPSYFCETSGTTSGVKYIPLTAESLRNQIKSTKDALLNYIYETGNTDFLKGKVMFLQGSPKLSKKNGFTMGRLSGIVAHHVPYYLQRNRLPSWEANLTEDWEEKVNKIVSETLTQNLTLIGGIPPWVQGYFEKLVEKTGKPIKDIFKNLSVYVHGGVNFKPYEPAFKSLIGKTIDYIETFPASEGFFAYQDKIGEKGLRLEVNSGIFYEFIPLEAYNKGLKQRIPLAEVKCGIDYVLVISTNAGLWAYDMGDVIRFISVTPYRIIFSGRSKHFISAYGEHVIGKEVEEAINDALAIEGGKITEFTVAPLVEKNTAKDKFNYQWYIEFLEMPSNLEAFTNILQSSLQRQNKYYNDLVNMNLLGMPNVRIVKQGGFNEYMKSIGKLGGQNKVPKLQNDTKIIDKLQFNQI